MLSNNRCIVECRKFSPNIFNKNKCTGCFGKREEHNSTALDHNRVSRTCYVQDDNKSKYFLFTKIIKKNIEMPLKKKIKNLKQQIVRNFILQRKKKQQQKRKERILTKKKKNKIL